MVAVRLSLVAVLSALACAFAAPAQAAFPGANGKLAYDSDADGDFEIYTVNPDGTGKTKLTNNSARDVNPAWSPDGSKILFQSDRLGAFAQYHDIWVMNADGSNPQRIVDMPRPVGPVVWSPDGSRIAFSYHDCPCGDPPSYLTGYLYVANADGSGATPIASAPQGSFIEPSWAPDGTEIAFAVEPSYLTTPRIATVEPDGSNLTNRTTDNCWELGPDWSPDAAKIVFESDNALVTMNRDGTGAPQPCGAPPRSPFEGESPVWSPDGTKIAFLRAGIHLVNPDFTGEQAVPGTTNTSRGLDWQPIPINAYPRPKGATPFLTYLVPAYDACASPNRQHGPPLAFASCNPPTQSSTALTVGSADSNGKPTKSVSSVRFDTVVGSPSIPGDQADVNITAQVIDVYTQGTLLDYAGELTASTPLRITDKLNTPHPGGPGAGTVSDIPYGFTIPCAETADATIGGSCLLSTSADALAPGAVTETKRSIWALGQVVIYDANGDPFMKQGIFVP
jgi:TolB protein